MKVLVKPEYSRNNLFEYLIVDRGEIVTFKGGYVSQQAALAAGQAWIKEHRQAKRRDNA